MKVVKHISFVILLCCLALGMSAQTAQEEIFANIHRSAANHYAYPEPRDVKTVPPAGYKPFYLSHYARHGSRYRVNPQDYKKPLEILWKAKMDGVLTALGEKTLGVVDSIARMAEGRYGDLTPLGARQHRAIAGRMYNNFPEIFRGTARVDARSTVVIRCILSMTAECLQLQSMNPKLQIKNDASHHDMYYMNNEDDYFRKQRKTKEAVAAKEAFRKEHLHPERLMKSLFTNEDYVKWKVDAGNLMSYLFELAVIMQNLDTDIQLYSLFTKEECYDFWLINNVDWYINYGPSPVTQGKMPYLEANLLKNILDTADTCLVKKENSATLRFGHESCVLPLACLLELGDCGYQTTDLHSLADTWRNYKIFPMACNIQFVFYRKRGKEDILVKVLLNEQEMKLPVKSELAPYYHWKDVETYYRNKLEKFKR